MNGMLITLALLQAAAAPQAPTVPDYPFQVGESFSYSAKLGIIKLGRAAMQVAAMDTLRGQEAFRMRFELEGGTLGFDINNVMRSWVSVQGFRSLKFEQDFDEDGKIRHRVYDIFPDSGLFHERVKDETKASPANPLDDAAFFYFIRFTPLEVGRTYKYDRYFHQDRNPVIVRVEKREKCELPGDVKTQCLVIRPIVGERGMFAPRAEARIWLTDDARRIPVRIKSKFMFGTVTLQLEDMVLPDVPVTTPT